MSVIFHPGFQLVDGDDLNSNFGLVLPLQRSVKTAAQAQIIPADLILTMNLTAPTTIALPRSVTRAGKPLIFVDAGLQCGAFPVTLLPFGTETIVNWQTPASLIMNVAGQVVGIHPFNDGVNTGWFLP